MSTTMNTNTNPHALVVEDDQQIIDDVQYRLESLGHTYDCAETQEETRNYLKTAKYSYVLLDLALPVQCGKPARVQTGLNLLDEIAESPGGRDAPIIVMTGSGLDGPDLAIQVLRSGRAVDFIKKPFTGNGESLESRIRKALEARRGPPGAATVAATAAAPPGPSTQAPSRLTDSGGPAGSESRPRPDLTWARIAISFRDQHTVAVRIGDDSQIYNYSQMGMADRRSGMPTVQWKLLSDLAEKHGVLDWSNPKANRKNQKRREILSRDLRAVFGIDADPLVFDRQTKGWKTRFSIGFSEGS